VRTVLTHAIRQAMLLTFCLCLMSRVGLGQTRAAQFEQVPAVMPALAFTPPSEPLQIPGPHNDPSVAVVEFDGNGELWTPCSTIMGAPRCQSDYAAQFIRQARSSIPTGSTLTVLTFIHGWTHNAMWDDQNYLHLRQAIDCLNWGETSYRSVYAQQLSRRHDSQHYDLACTGVKPRPGERFVGVYIGWQGTPPNLSRSNSTLISVFKTAQKTAASQSLRKVLLQLGSAAKAQDDSTAAANLILIGHSMGGLIVERVASAMLTAAPDTLQAPPCDNGRTGRTVPIDMFLLINAANNSTEGLQLIQKMKAGQECHSDLISQQLFSPLIISVHSNTDRWTGQIGAWGAELFTPLPAVRTPPIINDPTRTEVPPSNHDLSRRTFNDSTFLLNLCYIDENSSMGSGVDASRTGDFICDRVAQKVIEAKVRENKTAGLPDPTVDGVDTGAYQLLRNICDVGAAVGTAEACTEDTTKLQSRQRDALNHGLRDVLAFPTANVSSAPNMLFNLYTRVDPGCRETAEGAPQDRPLCLEGDSIMQPTPINKHPWNDTPYWAFNVPDSIIHGHSEFWTDSFSGMLLLMANYLGRTP
jgi:pimeloyl-ACP methyl ester carboxylesterase